jgi:hypothetical protein
MPSWSPGFSRWVAAGAAAYGRERLVRLKLMNDENILRVWRVAAERCIECTLPFFARFISREFRHGSGSGYFG